MKPISACIAAMVLGALPGFSAAAPVGAVSGTVELTQPKVVTRSDPVSQGATAALGGANASGAFSVPLSEMYVKGTVTSTITSAQGRAFLNYSFFNNTGSTLTSNFHYRINAGSLSFSGPTRDPGLTAQARNQLSYDGGSTWVDLGALTMDSTFGTANLLSRTGDFAALNGFATSAGGATWSATDFDKSLGTLAPGQTLTFSYAVFGSVSAATSAYCCFGQSCQGSFTVGDPSVLSAANNLMGLTFEVVKGGEVDLPATLALALAGVAGMGLVRRRRK